MESVLETTSPLTGDPAEIRLGAADLTAVAESLDVTLSELRAARAGTGMSGDAVAAYLEAAEVIAAELASVRTRYESAATSLGRYAGELDAFQSQARALRSSALEVSEQVWAATRHLHDATAEAERRVREDPTSLESMLVLPSADVQLAQERVDLAVADLHRHESDFADLLAEWHESARRCAAEIDTALERSTLNDSGWDVLCAGLEVLLDDVLPDLEIWLDAIAVVCTVLAILVIFAGPAAALSPALFALSRAAQAGARIVAIVNAVATTALVASGRRSATALVELGADLAFDRIGGRLADGAVSRLGRAAANGLEGAAEGLALVSHDAVHSARGTLVTRAAILRAHSVDDWISKTLDPKLTAASPGGALSGWERPWRDVHGVFDAADAAYGRAETAIVSALLDSNAGHASGTGAAVTRGVDAWASPAHATDGLTWQVVDLAEELSAGRGTDAQSSDAKAGA